MIAAFISHALVVSGLCALAAWLLERSLIERRRVVWAVGIAIALVLPLLHVAMNHTASGGAAEAAQWNGDRAGNISAAFTTIQVVPPMTEHPNLEFILAASWLMVSCAAIATLASSRWRLSLRAKRWKLLHAHGHSVLLSQNTGPAVFGAFKSRIVVPQWFMNAEPELQRVVLAHEQQHVCSRDPLLYLLALIAVSLVPWNLPLHWQLRRLRFALETDCDRRVTKSGIDPFQYAEVLIRINQHEIQAPMTAMALIDRHASRLERRIVIMTTPTHRFSKSVAAVLLALSAACVFAAASIEVPTTLSEKATLKPPPDGFQLGHRFEEFFASKYPTLFTERSERTPIVAVLINPDRTIAQTALFDSALPIGQIHPTTDMFTHLGLKLDEVPYVGAMVMQSPTIPNRTVLVVYTERKVFGQEFVSALVPDTRAIDRAIFKQHFSSALQKGVPAGQRPWILCDRTGRIVRSGIEKVDPRALNRTLESRFAGIKTEEITVTPVTDDAGGHVLDADGQAVQLASVWLATDSPSP